MSRVMKIGARDDIGQRAMQTLWEVNRSGGLPQQWTFGRDVWDRLRRDFNPEFQTLDTFFGLPFVVKGLAPPDLLELDVF